MKNKEHVLCRGGAPDTGSVRLKHLYVWPYSLQHDDDEFPEGTELIVDGSKEENKGRYHAFIEMHTGYIVPQRTPGNVSECGPGVQRPDNPKLVYVSGDESTVPKRDGVEIEYNRETLSLGNEEVDFLIEALLMVRRHFKDKSYDAA